MLGSSHPEVLAIPLAYNQLTKASTRIGEGKCYSTFGPKEEHQHY